MKKQQKDNNKIKNILLWMLDMLHINIISCTNVVPFWNQDFSANLLWLRSLNFTCTPLLIASNFIAHFQNPWFIQPMVSFFSKLFDSCSYDGAFSSTVSCLKDGFYFSTSHPRKVLFLHLPPKKGSIFPPPTQERFYFSTSHPRKVLFLHLPPKKRSISPPTTQERFYFSTSQSRKVLFLHLPPKKGSISPSPIQERFYFSTSQSRKVLFLYLLPKKFVNLC